MTRHTISLPDQLSQFVSQQVDSGKFSSISDYLRDLIRNDQKDKEQAIEQLRQLIQEGEQGNFVPFSMEDIVANAKKKMGV